MIIKRVMAGVYGANCYIVMDEDTKEAVVLDPGGDVDDVEMELKKLGATVKYIILTHGHFDHTTGVESLKHMTKASVAIGVKDNEMILSGAQYYGPLIEGGADICLKHKDVITFGKCNMEVIETPGHTAGGICLKIEDSLFTGDTLFKHSIGRSDLLGGDHNTLINSIKSNLMCLEDNMVVYPGHGPSSTIGEERRYNPFL